jgi:hypothetical protein
MRGAVLLVAVAALVAPVVATAADGEPKKALTKAGQTTARSVVLKRADLGSGFTSVARAKDQHLPKAARCSPLDEGDLTVTGDAASPDFRLSQTGVFVTVGSTSWTRGSATQTATCLGDIVRLSAGPGEKITVVSAKKIPFPAVSQKAAAYRIVVSISLRGAQSVRAYVDAVILQHGRIQSGILFTSIGRPVGDADRLALASVVASRMAKAALPSGPIA